MTNGLRRGFEHEMAEAHVRSQLAMLRVGLARRDAREVIGQLLRIPAGALGSAAGLVPLGNTGGANVSAFRPMPIADDLARLLAATPEDDR